MPKKPRILRSSASTEAQQASRREADRRRNQQPHRKIYNRKAWKQTRSHVLEEHPLCQDCEREPATQVHHVIKLADSLDLAHDTDNLQALCESCHSRRTQRGE